MEEKIIITFLKGGRGVKIEVEGVQGPRCLELTKPLEDAFGGNVERETKAEFYAEAEAPQQVPLKK